MLEQIGNQMMVCTLWKMLYFSLKTRSNGLNRSLLMCELRSMYAYLCVEVLVSFFSVCVCLYVWVGIFA